MRHYLLDSGPLAACLFGRKIAREIIRPWIINRETAISIISYGEVTEYIKGYSDFARHQKNLKDLVGEVYNYSPNYSILDRYADIRRELRPPHGPGLIGDIDTIIAATAMEYDLVLVTADHDFERVPGLQVKVIDIRAR